MTGTEDPVESKLDLRPEKISSSMTRFLRDLFPPLWTGAFGVVMVGVWFEWFQEPTPQAQKLAVAFLWAVTSILIRLWTRSLREVWVTDQELIVTSDGHGVRVPFSAIRDIKESRGQKVKTVRLLLAEQTPVGTRIRFIPIHRFQAPFTDHPVVKELRQRTAHVPGPGGAEQDRLPRS
jgi:hypothetical protein